MVSCSSLEHSYGLWLFLYGLVEHRRMLRRNTSVVKVIFWLEVEVYLKSSKRPVTKRGVEGWTTIDIFVLSKRICKSLDHCSDLTNKGWNSDSDELLFETDCCISVSKEDGREV